VPEDRLGTGLAPSVSIASNFALKSYRRSPASSGPFLRLRRIRERAIELIKSYRIAAPGPAAPVRLLSGGNLQKVVLAREFSGQPKVLVAASPTRGLDVGAIESVHTYLHEAAANGVGVLLLSEDLDEILTLADRIAVIYEGRVLGETARADANVEEIGLLMAGGNDPRRD
jgi:general nucleoside transport system ATP-binding protein